MQNVTVFSFLVQSNTTLLGIFVIAKTAVELHFIMCSLFVAFQVVVAGGLVVAKIAEISLAFVYFPNVVF